MSSDQPVLTAPAVGTPSLTVQTSAAVFLVMRRMRTPLIALISIFAISVLGLALIPGESPEGEWHMGIFDAFYVMSYTATTIGYGEIPQPFSDAQRMWVTLSIYLSVIGWAYAIGTLLALLQDSGFKRALAVQRFARRVSRIREPFWLMAGHGQTGEVLGQRLDQLGRRFVVLDLRQPRVDVLELGSYLSDVPALAGDARNPEALRIAGLGNPACEGVLAITDDDEANLAIVMATSVLRPGLTVISRCTTPAISRRMTAFGSPTVINPFDRFGDHFRIELRAPATERLSRWLVAPTGEPLPAPLPPVAHGSWIVCGYGRFGTELTRDLRADGIDVTIIDPSPDAEDAQLIRGDGTEAGQLRAAGIERAAGFVAGTDNDITNLSLISAARRRNPEVFVVARQNNPANAALFDAMHVDMHVVPTDVVAREALALIGTPLLWQFLQQVPQQSDGWAQDLIDRLVRRSGDASPELWRIDLTRKLAPAVLRQMGAGPFTIGDLLRDPDAREEAVAATVLLVLREGGTLLTPADDVELQPGDALLVAGRSLARQDVATTLYDDPSAVYVATGERVPSSWVWRAVERPRSGKVGSRT